ncbi:MAG: type II secretion system GspH family protein [Elusimicrobium sp.]|nr:type II secretion system GspH family protein [Elusimicrobium sp.]
MKNKRGFTLVEILVALFLTGLVMAGLVGLWVSSSNFASAGKQELLFKNMFSMAERTLYRDISEASYVTGGSSLCNRFLTVYKNYSPDLDVPKQGRCFVAPNANSSYTIVEYCFVNNNIYRAERITACGTQPPSCVCGTGSKLLLQGVTAQPTAAVTADTNMVTISFSAATTLGREKRPLQKDFNKTFAFPGGGN